MEVVLVTFLSVPCVSDPVRSVSNVQGQVPQTNLIRSFYHVLSALCGSAGNIT